MRVTVIGANGMLGQDLVATIRMRGADVIGLDMPEVDVTSDIGLKRIPSSDWVINCAAFTDVDGAETQRQKAFAVNADGAWRLARWCAERSIPIVHISTDYVFNGMKGAPYVENDAVSPVNVYGASKLAGEQAVAESGARFMIVRTQSLFGKGGKNFVDTLTRRAKAVSASLRVVNDQTSCPTYTLHLAEAIFDLLNCGQEGIVHVSAAGQCTWYEFAVAIVAKTCAGVSVEPVSSDEFNSPARRPPFSVLDCGRFMAWTGRGMPSWQEGLDLFFSN